MDLFQNMISNILKRSIPMEPDQLIQEVQAHQAMQLSESLEDQFVDSTDERNHTSIDMFSSGRFDGTFNTSQYLTPAHGQSILIPNGPQQCLDNSQNMGVPSVYSTPQDMAQAYHYTGESTTCCDLTNTVIKPNLWPSIPVRHTTSLPGDLQTPMPGNMNLNQAISWTSDDNYLPVNHSNFNEACPDSNFYFDEKGQLILPTNHMQ